VTEVEPRTPIGSPAVSASVSVFLSVYVYLYLSFSHVLFFCYEHWDSQVLCNVSASVPDYMVLYSQDRSLQIVYICYWFWRFECMAVQVSNRILILWKIGCFTGGYLTICQKFSYDVCVCKVNWKLNRKRNCIRECECNRLLSAYSNNYGHQDWFFSFKLILQVVACSDIYARHAVLLKTCPSRDSFGMQFTFLWILIRISHPTHALQMTS
jgi:hypothetical protein